jgi:5-enolpyruvylshikimate-3-phosphate synthase
MALSIAGLNSESEIIIHDAEANNKSYPDFYNTLLGLGAFISLKN